MQGCACPAFQGGTSILAHTVRGRRRRSVGAAHRVHGAESRRATERNRRRGMCPWRASGARRLCSVAVGAIWRCVSETPPASCVFDAPWVAIPSDRPCSTRRGGAPLCVTRVSVPRRVAALGCASRRRPGPRGRPGLVAAGAAATASPGMRSVIVCRNRSWSRGSPRPPTSPK